MTSRPLRDSVAEGDPALAQALASSRERWRMLVHDGADLAFETDEAGRLILLTPEIVLGWPAERLIGTAASSLLFCAADPSRCSLFNPFATTRAVRGRRVWLRDVHGMPACMLISAAPVAERPGAVRGLGINVTEQEDQEGALAASLRQHEAALTLVRRMRGAALPFASLAVGLDELIRAIDAEGASLLLHDHDEPLRIAATAGQPWPGEPQILHNAVLELCEQPPMWLAESVRQSVAEGRSLLLCASTNHFIDRAVLALWREGAWSEAAWSDNDARLAAALLQAIQPILEHEQIQRETARLSRTDVLTGLFNRQGFTAELSRRLERLDREGHPAALMMVGLDKLAAINASCSVERGDAALCRAAAQLRETVRPTDLVARLGGDLFGLWLDNADQFTAAERADTLARAGIVLEEREAQRLTVSIGIAVRASRSFESIDSLLQRAWQAMLASKRTGGGCWQVSSGEPYP